eukprot:18803-Heterococcus_DN1.PRE.4
MQYFERRHCDDKKHVYVKASAPTVYSLATVYTYLPTAVCSEHTIVLVKVVRTLCLQIHALIGSAEVYQQHMFTWYVFYSHIPLQWCKVADRG